MVFITGLECMTVIQLHVQLSWLLLAKSHGINSQPKTATAIRQANQSASHQQRNIETTSHSASSNKRGVANQLSDGYYKSDEDGGSVATVVQYPG